MPDGVEGDACLLIPARTLQFGDGFARGGQAEGEKLGALLG